MHSFRLSDGCVIRFHDLAGSGVPLVFLHGLGCASSCDYPAVVRSPSLDGRHAILVDLLGFGFSDRPIDFEYSVEAHSIAVCELLTGLDLPHFDLYGHSMGGSVAIAAAARLSGRVRNLILSEPNLDPGGGQFSRSIAAEPEQDYVLEGHARCVEDATAAGNLIWAGSMRVASALAIHRGAASLVRGSSPTWRSQLLNLATARTVLFGERSLPDDDFIALPRAGVPTSIVPAAGHSMAWESPPGLAVAIARACSARAA